MTPEPRPPAAAQTLVEKYLCRVREIDGALTLVTPLTTTLIGHDFMEAYRELGLEDRIDVITGYEEF